MRKWTLKEKKKLFVVLIATVLAGVFGYIETLIPPIFGGYPYLRVQLGVMFVLFVLLCYGPAEASIVAGVRCIVFGLVTDDGYTIIFEWLALGLALVAVWLVLRLRKVGTLPIGAAYGVVYAFFYTAFASMLLKSGQLFAQLPQCMAFYMVNHLIFGGLAYIAIRFIPEKLLIDQLKS